MTEREEFLMPDHKSLLNIATWANVLAWIALAVYIFTAGVEILRFQDAVVSPSFFEMAMINDYVLLASRIAVSVFRGLAFFVALRAISLGLIIIVETSINSYEQQEGGDE